MKTTVYFKADEYNGSTHAIKIKELASSYNNSTNLKLWQVESEIYDESDITERLSNYELIFISKIEAHLLGKELQPDREIDDVIDGKYDFSFSLVTLEEAKTIKINELRQNTGRLIYAGFDYDGRHYGAEETDQIKWNTLLGKYTTSEQFPIENKVKDWDGGYVIIDNREHLLAVVDAGEEHVCGYTHSHKILKDQINACSTIPGLLTIKDDRT